MAGSGHSQATGTLNSAPLRSPTFPRKSDLQYDRGKESVSPEIQPATNSSAGMSGRGGHRWLQQRRRW